MDTLSGQNKLLTFAIGFLAFLQNTPTDTNSPADQHRSATHQAVQDRRLQVKSEWEVGERGTRSNSKKTQEANELECGHRLSDGLVTLSPLPP